MCVYLPHVILLFCFLRILSSMGAYWLVPQVMALLAGVLELSLHTVAYQRCRVGLFWDLNARPHLVP